ncbi:MAG TPA: nitrile hydratase subunit beta, partial [Dehalococcoidia bacterium]|nr:nitrile hydratase subunit beta [Dehalococcoidia bacterium]
DHQKMDWEMRADALHQVLGQKGIRRTDEMRRAMESLDPDLYRSLSYYERWTAALELLMVEKGFLTSDEIDRKVTQLNQGAN